MFARSTTPPLSNAKSDVARTPVAATLSFRWQEPSPSCTYQTARKKVGDHPARTVWESTPEKRDEKNTQKRVCCQSPVCHKSQQICSSLLQGKGPRFADGRGQHHWAEDHDSPPSLRWKYRPGQKMVPKGFEWQTMKKLRLQERKTRIPSPVRCEKKKFVTAGEKMLTRAGCMFLVFPDSHQGRRRADFQRGLRSRA